MYMGIQEMMSIVRQRVFYFVLHLGYGYDILRQQFTSFGVLSESWMFS